MDDMNFDVRIPVNQSPFSYSDIKVEWVYQCPLCRELIPTGNVARHRCRAVPIIIDGVCRDPFPALEEPKEAKNDQLLDG